MASVFSDSQFGWIGLQGQISPNPNSETLILVSISYMCFDSDFINGMLTKKKKKKKTTTKRNT